MQIINPAETSPTLDLFAVLITFIAIFVIVDILGFFAFRNRWRLKRIILISILLSVIIEIFLIIGIPILYYFFDLNRDIVY